MPLPLLSLLLAGLALPRASALYVSPGVSPVCSSAKLAWLSQPACTTFEDGICATVTDSTKCPGLHAAIDAAIAKATTPVFLEAQYTISGPQQNRQCTGAAVPGSGSPGAETAITIEPCALFDQPQNQQDLRMRMRCPPGTVATSASCASQSPANIGNPVEWFTPAVLTACVARVAKNAGTVVYAQFLMCVPSGGLSAGSLRAAADAQLLASLGSDR